MAQVGYQDTFPVFLRVAGYGYRFANAIPKPTRILLDLCNHPDGSLMATRDCGGVEIYALDWDLP